MSLMLSCEINRITISNRRGKEFALYNKGVVCSGNGGICLGVAHKALGYGTNASEALVFVLSARAAAHARAAAVKVRAIGFLSDAAASLFMQRLDADVAFYLCPCCAKPQQFIDGLRHDPHVSTSAAFRGI